MRISGWKHALSLGLAAVSAQAASATDLINHGGGVIVSARVVFVFWGPSFSNAASPDFVYASNLQSFRNQLGTSAAWQVLLQYGVQLTNLGAGTPDGFDTSTPPVNVTDALVQSKVRAYLTTHAFDNSTIYEVVIPKTSYSSSGTSTSCGGPSLAYCSYHSSFSSSPGTVKYSIQPYPSCSGCKVSGWSDSQNQEHFVCHETRDTVTDPVNGWYDSTGEEVSDKCSWTVPPLPTSIANICGKAWSNQVHGCV